MFGGEKKRSIEVRLVELETENRLLNERLEELKTEKQSLLEKLDRAYEALVAKEAPAAYADLKADQAESAMTEDEKERRANMRELAAATGLLQEVMEGPVFRSVEDIQELLRGPKQTGPPKIESVHQNDES